MISKARFVDSACTSSSVGSYFPLSIIDNVINYAAKTL